MADPCSSSSMAGSASTSYSQNFQVFINHRGPDAKDTFATPLYRSLTQSGLLVFLDKPEMQLGHDIPSQIRAAIQVASLHVAILSPRYAESEWCLNELLLMIQSGKTIIPVFYHVKPSDLRWTGEEKNGPYARALYAHEKKKRYDPQTIQQWRTALSRVANISGLELEAFNGEEEKLQRQEELLSKVVQSVLKIVPPPLDVAEYPTGLGGKLEEFESTVLSEHQREHRVGAKVVGIVGLGGIGKTTLARYFFNLKRSDYNMSSLLFDVKDVRENAAKISLNSLQRELIKDLKNRDIPIKRWEEGKEILKKNLSSSDHALIVVDDVDHIDQLDAFLPIKDVLHPNSLILVTSRDKGVLRRAKIVESSIYHLRGLTRAHSQQLFCCYAFSQQVPKPGFKNLVEGFTEACHGLPLSLKVLGALLCGEDDHSYWKELLDGLNRLLPDDIEKSLRISYNSLNEEEQQIFLDIACFCIGRDRDKWIRIWGGSGWSGLVGFRNLQNKCLVDVDSYNMIRMHDHLRDMGRNIAGSSRSMPRRLWQPIHTLKDINDLLEESSPVITEVRGFRISKHFERHNQSRNHSRNQSRNHSRSHEVLVMRKLQLLEAQGDFVESILTRVESPKLIWLDWRDCPYPSLPSWISMHDLRVLEVRGDELKQLWESERQAPLQLRELIIDAPLVEFPKSLGQLQHLEIIVATNTSLEMFPKEFNMPSLKYLKLSGCKFQRLWQCEYGAPLQLRQLTIDAQLLEFPKSLGQLQHLETIVAKNTYLEKFPKEFNMPSLKYLELHGCHFQRLWQSEYESWKLIIDGPLVEFPKSLEQFQHLEKIVARTTSLEMFPEEFNMPSLKYLELHGCKLKRLWQSEYGAPLQLRELMIDAPLVEFPKSLGQLQHLEKIVATNTSLEMFPKEFNMPSLKYLELSGCKFQRLWQCEYGAPLQLRTLIIDAPLVEFPKSLGQLKYLEKIDARRTSPASVREKFNLPILKYFKLDGFEIKERNMWGLIHELIIDAPLVEFPMSLGKLKHLERVVAKTSQASLPDFFGNLTNLQRIDLSFCKRLEILPNSFRHLLQLEHLHLTGCCSLTISSETLGNFTELECLDLSGCLHMELLPPQIARQQSLVKLNLLGTILKELPCDLASLSNLKVLRVGSPSLEVLPPSVGCLRNLKQLWLHECEKLQCLPDSVELLSELTELKIWKCGIQYLPPAVMKMRNLKVLAVCRCPLRKLPFCPSLELSLELPLDSSINEGMIQLRELQLYRTEVLEVSFPERVCPNLQDLRIVRCEHLVQVGALPTPLRNLDLGYCGELRKIRGIYGVTKLQKLDMRGCNNIEVEELQGLGTLISSGLKFLRSQLTEHFEDDSSIEQNVFSDPFCYWCPPLDFYTEDSGKAARQPLEDSHVTLRL